MIIPEASKFKNLPLWAFDEVEKLCAKGRMIPLISSIMKKDEIIVLMLSHENISRHNSLTAWEEVERENPEAFKAYYMDLAKDELSRATTQTRQLLPPTPDVFRGGPSNPIDVGDILKIETGASCYKVRQVLKIEGDGASSSNPPKDEPN